MIVEFFGKVVGFALFLGIVYLLIKSKDTHPENFELEEGENIIEMTKGDYWEIQLMIFKTQHSGEFAFTNKRILFRQNFVGDVISVPYSEIAEIKKSTVLFFPVSFDVKAKDGKSYRFAMMKRQRYLDLINSCTGNISEK